MKEMSNSIESLANYMTMLESRTPPQEHISFMSNGKLVTLYPMPPMQVTELNEKKRKSNKY